MVEVTVRQALRAHVMKTVTGAALTLDELWVPRSHERADVAVIGRSMVGFEIKTERDTLKRLPRQMLAYGRLFDRCSVVVAERHRHAAQEILPEWWGIMVIDIGDKVAFTSVRKARPNPALDPEILVRLLWRDEVISALVDLGHAPQNTATRGSLWRGLLGAASLSQIRASVRRALLQRDHTNARLPSRRGATVPALAPGQ